MKMCSKNDIAKNRKTNVTEKIKYKEIHLPKKSELEDTVSFFKPTGMLKT